jgi:hypothetical protein
MNRQTVFLSDAQLKKLKAISAKSGAKLSTLIRMAVEEYLKGRKA